MVFLKVAYHPGSGVMRESCLLIPAVIRRIFTLCYGKVMTRTLQQLIYTFHGRHSFQFN